MDRPLLERLKHQVADGTNSPCELGFYSECISEIMPDILARRRFASARIGFVVLGVPSLVPPAVGIQLISFALFSVFYIHLAGGYLNAGEFFAVIGMFFSAFLGIFRLADINLFALVPKGIGPAFFGHLLVLLFWGRVVIGDDNSCVASTAQGGVTDLVGTCPKDFWLEWIAEGDADFMIIDRLNNMSLARTLEAAYPKRPGPYRGPASSKKGIVRDVRGEASTPLPAHGATLEFSGCLTMAFRSTESQATDGSSFTPIPFERNSNAWTDH